MFCPNCGKQVPDKANFCGFCGGKIAKAGDVIPLVPKVSETMAPTGPETISPAAAQPSKFGNSRYNTGDGYGVPANRIIQNAGRLPFRVKCPSCGHVQNGGLTTVCPKCKNTSTLDFNQVGFLQLYRMGSFNGSAAGMGIYIDEVPMGHVANKGQVIIPLEPGMHKVHCSINLLRRCEDKQILIEPGKVVYMKSQIKMGAWSNTLMLHFCNEADMPPM